MTTAQQRLAEAKKIEAAYYAANPPTPKRGGKRTGAGRKSRRGVPVVTSSIALIPEAWATLDSQRGVVSRSEWIYGLILKADLKTSQ